MSASCERLDLFVDGELDEAEAAAFRGHLGRCAACADALTGAVVIDALAADARRARARTVELPAAGAPGARAEAAPLPGGADVRPAAPLPGGAGVRLAAPLPGGAGVRLAAPLPGGAGAPAVVSPLARRSPRRALLGGAVGLAAAAAVVLVLGARRPPAASPMALLASGEERPLDGRLAYPGLDAYRSLGVTRAATPPVRHDVEPLLAAIGAGGDPHALAVAHLLAGDVHAPVTGQAFARAGRSPAVLSDRAAWALAAGKPQEALALADEALAGRGDLVQALWNRAAALEALGRPAEAAAAFEAVAARGERGWADEAQRRARALRARAR